jgi:hypothetical protein
MVCKEHEFWNDLFVYFQNSRLMCILQYLMSHIRFWFVERSKSLIKKALYFERIVLTNAMDVFTVNQ